MIKERVEHADFGDAIYRQSISLTSLPHGRFVWAIVNAECFFAILRHVRMHPINAQISIGCDNGAASLCALIVDRDGKSVPKRTLDNVSRHVSFLEPLNSIGSIRYAYLSGADLA